MADHRYVNLQKIPTSLTDEEGRNTLIQPFRDGLDHNNRREEGVYIVEGEHWAQYVPSGALSPFPKAIDFGLEAFPPLPVLRAGRMVKDGRPAEHRLEEGDHVARQKAGRFTGAGFVVRDGKKVVTNPETGEEELHELTEEEANAPTLQEAARDAMKSGIAEHLDLMGVKTADDFKALTDEQLLQLPGVTAQAIPQLRENMERVLGKPSDHIVEEEPTQVVRKKKRVKKRTKKTRG